MATAPPVMKKKPPPPPPAAKRPNLAKKPVQANGVNGESERNSAASSGVGSDATGSGGSFAGGLAEALKQRQAAMRAKEEDDDDW